MKRLTPIRSLHYWYLRQHLLEEIIRILFDCCPLKRYPMTVVCNGVGVVVVCTAKSQGLKLRRVEETFIRIMQRCHRD